MTSHLCCFLSRILIVLKSGLSPGSSHQHRCIRTPSSSLWLWKQREGRRWGTPPRITPWMISGVWSTEGHHNKWDIRSGKTGSSKSFSSFKVGLFSFSEVVRLVWLKRNTWLETKAWMGWDSLRKVGKHSILHKPESDLVFLSSVCIRSLQLCVCQVPESIWSSLLWF